MKKRIITLLTAVVSIFCGCSSINAESAVPDKQNTTQTISITADNSNHNFAVEDIINFQHFLLNKSTNENFQNKSYDKNKDGIWNVFDLSMTKNEVLYPVSKTSDTIVVYFSRTNNTEKIANYITDYTNADSYKIEAAVPYSDADIAYNNSSCRANKEQNDKSCRPEIADPLDSLENYDVVYIGYPIWWGEEPRIIDTFLESYDFSDKTVIPFCTSASSGIATSEENIKNLVPIGNQLEGKRFSPNANKSEVEKWVDGLNLEEKIHKN